MKPKRTNSREKNAVKGKLASKCVIVFLETVKMQKSHSFDTNLNLSIFRISTTDSDQNLWARTLNGRNDVEMTRHFFPRQNDDATDRRFERRRRVADVHELN